MTEHDRQRLLTTLVSVCAYYDRELTDVAVAVWFEDLADHDIGAIERAFVAHRRDPERGQWCPKSADILRHLVGDGKERGALAWGHILAEVRRVGTHGAPRLDDAQQAAVDAIGGWYTLCRGDESQLGHLARRFGEAFAAVDARERRETLLIGGPTGSARDVGSVLRSAGGLLRVVQ